MILQGRSGSEIKFRRTAQQVHTDQGQVARSSPSPLWCRIRGAHVAQTVAAATAAGRGGEYWSLPPDTVSAKQTKLGRFQDARPPALMA